MINFIIENKSWLFSGIAVAIPIAIISWYLTRKSSNNKNSKSDKNQLRVSNLKGSKNKIIGGGIMAENNDDINNENKVDVVGLDGDENIIIGGSVKRGKN